MEKEIALEQAYDYYDAVKQLSSAAGVEKFNLKNFQKAWKYEPYNIYYNEYGDKNSDFYREIISIESTKEFDGWDFYLYDLEEFKKFIMNNY